MTSETFHTESVRVLIIDDEESVRNDLKMILKKTGYAVKIVTGSGKRFLDNAIAAAQGLRPHIAIVDLQLFEEIGDDRSGLKLLDHLRSARCILYSNYISHDITREVTKKYVGVTWVSKFENPQTLLAVVKDQAREVSSVERKIDLKKAPGWSKMVITGLLGKETDAPASLVDDLIVQLFPQSTNISLEALDQTIITPQSVSRGRSILMKVFHDGKSEKLVLKIAPSEAIDREAKNYASYIEGNLKGRFNANIHGKHVIFWDLGAVLYSLMDHSGQKLVTFREFYHSHTEPSMIIAPLAHLYTSTWEDLYRQAQGTNMGLNDFYEQTFHLQERLQSLPFREEFIRMVGFDIDFPNPVVWMIRHREQSQIIRIREAVTHGDLHSDNLFVDDNHAWAIDFERTGPGHILRDFIEMEIDIFTRLLLGESSNELTLEQVIVLAVLLADDMDPCRNTQLHDRLTLPVARKALNVIKAQRALCRQITNLTDFREYLWGMLFDLVFLVTLIPEDKPQRNLAMLLAAIICQRLKDGVSPSWPKSNWLSALNQVPIYPTPTQLEKRAQVELQPSGTPSSIMEDLIPGTNRPVVVLGIVGIMLIFVLGILWGVTKVDPSPLILTITIALLLPLIIVFSFVVAGFIKGDDGVRMIRDIALSAINRFIRLEKDKE